MSRGLAVVLKKKLDIAASYLHWRFNKATSSEEAALQRQVHEDLKEIAGVSSKSSFTTLASWDPSASVGHGLSSHNQPVAHSSCSVQGRQSPSKGEGSRRKAPACGKSSSMEQPADL